MRFALVARNDGRRPGWLGALLCIALLSGCAAAERPLSVADGLARGARMMRATVRTDDFLLVTYARLDKPGDVLKVYIEGDGRAWITPRRISSDPTPNRPIGLELAVNDPAPNLLYMARPCHHVATTQDPRCDSRYWSDGRFAPEVIRAMGQAMDHYRALGGISAIDIVGFSGGGAVAALLAAERPEIRSLRTVAGNLAPEALHAYHEVSQLRGSLNLAEMAPRLAALPQIHFLGTEDKVVPPSVGQSFARAVGTGACLRFVSVPGVGHEDGWARAWPNLVGQRPACASR